MKITCHKRLILAMVVLCLTHFVHPIKARVIPTDQWVNFFSKHTIFHGGQVPVGAIIDAYDPDGVHCGTFTVTSAGEYGFLIVYRDDALTENVDEGAVPGDTITFKINGAPVKVLGPNLNIWSEQGAILEVDLADNFSPTIVASIPEVIMHEDNPTKIIADLDTIFSDPDQDSLKFFSNSSTLAVMDSIADGHQLMISLAADWFGNAFLIYGAQDLWFTVNDTISIQVMPLNDPPVIISLPDTTFSNDTNLMIDLNKYVEDVDNEKSALIWAAEVQFPYQDSVFVEVNNITKQAIFRAKSNFSGTTSIVFTVTDDSLDSDQDTMLVHVSFPTSVIEHLNFLIPKNYFLNQNHPNPFNVITAINYQLPNYSPVTLKIVNFLGQEVAVLIDQPQQSGDYTIFWDATGQPSGVYLLWFKAGQFSQMRKMIILR